MALQYNPPPGWQVPRGEWRPPLNWEPDPSWPPAPPDWNFWLDVDQKAKHRPRPASRRKYLGAIAIVALVAIGLVGNALRAGEPAQDDTTGSTPVNHQIPITRGPIGSTWSPTPTPTPVSTKVKATTRLKPKPKPKPKPTARPPVRTTTPVVRPTKPPPVPTIRPTCTVAPDPLVPHFCAF